MQIAIHSCDLFIIGENTDWYCYYKKISDNNLLDRLFRKYVRQSDVESTKMALLQMKLSDRYKKMYNRLIEAFDDQAYFAEYNFQHYGRYVPIRIILFDEPYCTLSDEIPLEDYDNNEGEPFWMRPQYIIENYSQMYKKEKEKNNK